MLRMLLLVVACLLVPPAGAADVEPVRWAIALHGGAGRLSRDLTEDRRRLYEAELREALRTGVDVLSSGGTALDATERVVKELEDCPLFNAGCGSVFDVAGGHAMDASIMDGTTLRTGGVASVTSLRNPIHGARLVMERSPHVLMGGEAAEAFCAKRGAELAPRNYFSVPWRFQKLQAAMRERGEAPPEQPLHGWPPHFPPGAEYAVEDVGGTVGCVALDNHSNLAAATSTGGRNAKLVGRIGDSPVPGAGNYANRSVAVGGTGKGEEYLRHFVCGRVAMLVESGQMTLKQAVDHCLDHVLQPGDGGLIAVDKNGVLCLRSTTGSMPRGAADSTGRFEISIWCD